MLQASSLIELSIKDTVVFVINASTVTALLLLSDTTPVLKLICLSKTPYTPTRSSALLIPSTSEGTSVYNSLLVDG